MRSRKDAMEKGRVWAIAGMASFILAYSLCSQVLADSASYNYDALNRLTSVSYGNGASVNYAYDASGNRLTQIITPPSPAVAIPAAPFNVTATAGNASATVSFAASSGSTYTVTSSPGGITAMGSTSPIVVTGLTNGISYTFTVTASNSAGAGSPSAASNSVTPQAVAVVPGAPTAVTAIAGNAQATVSFVAPGDNGGAPITGYTATANPGGATATGSASPVTVTGLTNGVAYTFTVTATNSAGSGPTSVASASVTPSVPSGFTPVLTQGFNLLGNSLDTALDVASIFGSQGSPTAVTNDVVSVWKWDATNGKWLFHSPLLSTAANASFAASHGYDVLASIEPGEGYWVNALTGLTLPVQTGLVFHWNGAGFGSLPGGFNLIAHGQTVSPSQFNVSVSAIPPATGVVPTDNFVSLWAWDAGQAKWYFYSPLLESLGGLAAIKSHADDKGYLHFQDHNKTIDVGVGFWVNKF